MAKEIERKFLVKNDAWRGLAPGTVYRQGYLSSNLHRSVRVRMVENRAFLTIKGRSRGAARLEFEYEIPPEDADEILTRLCQRPIIEKTRYKIEHKGLLWEVDEFSGENEGLIVAEVELSHESQEFEKPAWVEEEVTHDPRYLNANLIKNPYTKWKEKDKG
jgi:CYTH domain-containing protein